MEVSQITGGRHEVLGSDISLTSKVDLGTSAIKLKAQGSVVPCTGTIDMLASGTISAQAGQTKLFMEDKLVNQAVLLEGGPVGKVTVANGPPVGGQTITMDALTETIEINNMKDLPAPLFSMQSISMSGLTQSIEISNGAIPGAMQTITLDGLTQSIELNAGGTPISPCIQMSPLGITLSMGPTSSIEITPAGVSIKGLLVDVEGQVQAKIGGAMVDVEGTAMTQVKGGVVMVN